jgi:hypothetical protein
VEEKAALASLGVRQAVRGHLMAGRCDGASALLAQHAPELVQASGEDARPDLDVYFSVSCLKFIELIRCALAPGAAVSSPCQVFVLRGVMLPCTPCAPYSQAARMQIPPMCGCHAQ